MEYRETQAVTQDNPSKKKADKPSIRILKSKKGIFDVNRSIAMAPLFDKRNASEKAIPNAAAMMQAALENKLHSLRFFAKTRDKIIAAR